MPPESAAEMDRILFAEELEDLEGKIIRQCFPQFLMEGPCVIGDFPQGKRSVPVGVRGHGSRAGAFRGAAQRLQDTVRENAALPRIVIRERVRPFPVFAGSQHGKAVLQELARVRGHVAHQVALEGAQDAAREV